MVFGDGRRHPEMLEFGFCCWSRWNHLQLPSCPSPILFKLPASLPEWPSGKGFAKGKICLGEIEVAQVSTFEKIWSYSEGGKSDKGVSFYKPLDIPDGYFCLGHYCQPNSSDLNGWVLVAKEAESSKLSFNEAMRAPSISGPANDSNESSSPLAKPINYTLVWGSDCCSETLDGDAYFWLPYPPDGYKAMGFVVTSTLNKPSIEEVRCVKEDLTETSEAYESIWNTENSGSKYPFSVWNMRPVERGMLSKGVCVGTYYCNSSLDAEDPLPVACLKNTDLDLSAMPTADQVHALISHYGPTIYFHPDEAYLPSSVNWFFENGSLLWDKEAQYGVPVAKDGANLPRGGSNDGEFWLDLPDDDDLADEIKKGNMDSALVYVHVKPMLGGTFTDIAMWVFCPFNGPVTLKIGVFNVSLSKIGEHVSDWEHFTLRISNFSGELWKIYFSQHSSGEWVNASDLEYIEGNKAIVYSSKHGHACFPHAGAYLQGDTKLGVGVRNDTAKSDFALDTSTRYKIVAAEYLNSNALQSILLEPGWLQFMREWGPTVVYDSRAELLKLVKYLPSSWKNALLDIFNKLPNELGGEEGPTGPKEKNNWEGDERD